MVRRMLGISLRDKIKHKGDRCNGKDRQDTEKLGRAQEILRGVVDSHNSATPQNNQKKRWKATDNMGGRYQKTAGNIWIRTTNDMTKCRKLGEAYVRE